MATSISCPQCACLLQIEEGHWGRQVVCGKCRTTFVAVNPAAITASPNLAPIVDPEAIRIGSLEVARPREMRRRTSPFADAGFDDEEPNRWPPPQGFVPGGGLVKTLKLLLLFTVLMSLVQLASDYFQYEMALRLIRRDDVPDTEITGNHVREFILAMAHLVLYVTTAVVFLIWFYRVHANLKVFGARGLKCTSGWAVGYWFVPFLNLIGPYKVAQEIWRHSALPHSHEGADARNAGSSSLILFWWLMWLIVGFISYIAFLGGLDDSTPESLRSATVVDMVAETAMMIAGLLALAVVSAIDRRQAARAEWEWDQSLVGE